MTRTFRLIVGCAALLVAHTGFAPAAEIKAFSTIGVQSALEELAPQFEKTSGHKLNISWATAAIFVKRVQAGESADLMVLTKQSLDALTRTTRRAPDPMQPSPVPALRWSSKRERQSPTFRRRTP